MGSEDKVGEAYVEIRATLDQLQRDLNKGERQTKKTQGRMQKMFSKVGGAVGKVTKRVAQFGVALAVGLVAGLGASTKAMLNTLDSIDKMSSKLGLTTDFLQEAAFAAAQSGIEFNTMSMAMQRFTRRAAEASKGTGEAKDAIKELGIDLLDGAGNLRSSEVLFTEAMAALAGVENAGDRLRLAFKLFDSEGAALVNVADRFGDLTKEARESGLVIESHVIKQGVIAKDTLNLLWTLVKTKLAPTLTDFAEFAIIAAEGLATLAQQAGVAWARIKDVFNLKPTNVAQIKDRLGEIPLEIDKVNRGLTEALELFQQVMAETKENSTRDIIEARYVAHIKQRQELLKTLREERVELGKQLTDLETMSEVPPPPVLDPIALARANALLGENNDVIKEGVEDLKDQASGLGDVWTSLESDASRSLARMLMDSEVTFEAMGKAFVERFTQQILENLIFQQIMGLARNLLGAAFGAVGAATAPREYGIFDPTEGQNPGGFIGPLLPGGGTAPQVNIINQSPSAVTAVSSLDGGVEVFIGEAASRSATTGGALSGALQDRYGLNPRALRG